jgi:hypothetical protein
VEVLLEHELGEHLGERRQRDPLVRPVQIHVEIAAVCVVGRGLEHPGLPRGGRLGEVRARHDAAPRLERRVD